VALPLAQMAKQKMPDSPLAADTLGWAYYKLGSAEPAITELEEGVQKVPNNPPSNITWDGLSGRRPFGIGREALQKALKDNPKFAQAADATAALQKFPRRILELGRGFSGAWSGSVKRSGRATPGLCVAPSGEPFSVRKGILPVISHPPISRSGANASRWL